MPGVSSPTEQLQGTASSCALQEEGGVSTSGEL